MFFGHSGGDGPLNQTEIKEFFKKYVSQNDYIRIIGAFLKIKAPATEEKLALINMIKDLKFYDDKKEFHKLVLLLLKDEKNEQAKLEFNNSYNRWNEIQNSSLNKVIEDRRTKASNSKFGNFCKLLNGNSNNPSNNAEFKNLDVSKILGEEANDVNAAIETRLSKMYEQMLKSELKPLSPVTSSHNSYK